MSFIEIPTLLFWENGNSWYGSWGQARFYIHPEVPEEGDPVLHIELWRGPLTRSLSEILETADFPRSEEGLARATAWLEERATQLNQC